MPVTQLNNWQSTILLSKHYPVCLMSGLCWCVFKTKTTRQHRRSQGRSKTLRLRLSDNFCEKEVFLSSALLMDVTSLVYPKVSIEPSAMIVMKLRRCQDLYPLSDSLVLSVPFGVLSEQKIQVKHS